MAFVATLHPPTSVLHACRGRFLAGADDVQMVIARGHGLELHQAVPPNGLKQIANRRVFGEIASLTTLRLPSHTRDSVVVLTLTGNIAVLSIGKGASPGSIVWNEEIVGNVADRYGRKADVPQCCVDARGQWILVLLYQGILKLIPAKLSSAKNPGVEIETQTLHIEELKVLDMQWLSMPSSSRSKPCIAVLFEDAQLRRRVKTYCIDPSQSANLPLQPGPFTTAALDFTPRRLHALPAPHYGLVAFGDSGFAYIESTGAITTTKKPFAVMSACTVVDNHSLLHLVADSSGSLGLVTLSPRQTSWSIEYERLGQTSIAACLCYLSDAVAFVGSHYGNSQVLRLQSHRLEEEGGNYFEVIDAWPNLAPITDFCVVNDENQGQSHLVTCSGAFQHGALKIVSNNVGVTELASVDLIPGIKRLWSLKASRHAQDHRYLLLAFLGETKLLHLYGDEKSHRFLVSASGHIANETTLLAGNIAHQHQDRWIQVTPSGVYTFSWIPDPVETWHPPTDKIKICFASMNDRYLALGTTLGVICLFDTATSTQRPIGILETKSEISCLHVMPTQNLCAIGFWGGGGVQVLELPTLKPVMETAIGSDAIPRSVLLAEFEHGTQLVVALDDGKMAVLDVSLSPSLAVSNTRLIALGTLPATLCLVKANEKTYAFASCDRPAVLYSEGNRLCFSGMTLRQLSHVSAFHAVAYPHSLAIATPNGLMLGMMDLHEKMHIREIPLREQARRIAHQPWSKSFGIIASQVHRDNITGQELDTSIFKLFDHQAFRVLGEIPFEMNESAQCIRSVQVEHDRHVYVIGTAKVLPAEEEPRSGRVVVVLVESLSDAHLCRIVSSLAVDGAVYSIEVVGDKLVCCINQRVRFISPKLTGRLSYSNGRAVHDRMKCD